MELRKCFLTGCYSGLLPEAPGTWGTLFGAFIALLILQLFPQSTLFLLAILITVIAVKEIDRYEKEHKTHDDNIIVIDEIAGIWIAISLLPKISLSWITLAFIFFRILDISKPSFIGKAEKKLKGGLAVMADDLLAGIFAGLLTGIVYVLWSNLA